VLVAPPIADFFDEGDRLVRSHCSVPRIAAVAIAWGGLVLGLGEVGWGQLKMPDPRAPRPSAKAPAVSGAPARTLTTEKTPAAKTPAAKAPVRHTGVTKLTETPEAPPKPLLMRYAFPEREESLVKVLRFYPKSAPMLEIQTPWTVYTKPSIELRMLAPDEPDTQEIRPLAFVGAVMKGALTNAVYKALEDVTELPLVRTMKWRDGEFQIAGFKNYLDRDAIRILYVPISTEEERAKAQEAAILSGATATAAKAADGDKKAGSDDRAKVPPRTIFYFLKSWAIDPETLRLELPAKQYGKPGRLRVWFLRGDSVVWQQTVEWPGMDGATDAPSDGAAKDSPK
jgi:hypothetical protein